MVLSYYRYVSTDISHAVSHSNGRPHKSCMRLSHSNGRAPTTKYKEND